MSTFLLLLLTLGGFAPQIDLSAAWAITVVDFGRPKYNAHGAQAGRRHADGYDWQSGALSVNHPGALLFVGDGHAAQGDGELTGDALETSMDIEFTVDVIEGRNAGHPLAENAEYLISIGIGGSLDQALQMATSGIVRWLERDYKLSASDAAIVAGFAIKYDIVDLVGTQVSVAAKLPKAALAKLRKVSLIMNLRKTRSAAAVACVLFGVVAASAQDAASGDAARGKALVESSGCFDCHRIDDRGSRLGPNLTRIGTLRTPVRLRQALVAPDEEVIADNRFVRIVTKDGTTVTGKLLNQDAISVQMMNPKEELKTYLRSNIREFTILDKGLMPSVQGKLNDQQVADIVSYLSSLKGS